MNFTGSDDEAVDDDFVDLTKADVHKLSFSDDSTLEFKPLYMLSVWKEPSTKDERISVAILLPSGISENIDDITVRIVKGQELELTIPWPSSFMNLKQLMQVWLEGDGVTRIEDYHPHCEGFAAYRMKFQKQETDLIHSKAIIHLPFEVISEFEQHLLGWEGNSQEVLFLILKAPSKMYKKDVGKLRMKRASGTFGEGSSSQKAPRYDNNAESNNPFCRLK